MVRRGRVKTLGGSRRTVNWRSPGHRPQPKTKSCHPPREPIDTSTAAGKCFLGMPGVFAEFETTLRRERQLEGIAKAKAAGIYKGRKPTVSADAIKALRANGKGPHGDRKGPGHLEDECISSSGESRTYAWPWHWDRGHRAHRAAVESLNWQNYGAPEAPLTIGGLELPAQFFGNALLYQTRSKTAVERKFS